MIDQPIARSEFETRYERIRQFLTEQDLGALVAYSPAHEHKWGQTGHVSYLSGWANHDRIVETVVVVPATGKPILLASGMQFMFDQASEVSPLGDMRLVRAVDPNAIAAHRPDGGDGPRDFAGEVLAICQENGVANKDIGVVGMDTMPAPFYEGISKGIGSKLRRTDDIVAQLRSQKSAGEVELMKAAAHLSDLGFETMLEVAKPGMRGIEIVAEMERVVRRQGADHAKYWMASGPAPDWNNTRLDIRPHERILAEGDLMASCSYVVYKGYWCHGHRTGAMRTMSPDLEKLCQSTRQAHDAALALMKPGVPIAQVGQALGEHVRGQGLELLGGRIGHGIGMDYSEQPVPLNDTNDTPLAEGMTIVLHGVYALPDTGKMFVPLGDVLHITAEGPELLMKFPRTPFVAG